MADIIRVELSTGFTVLQNAAIRDGRLSFKARGLLAYMLSMPPDWDFSITGLAKLNPDGKDSIRTGLAELEKAGYLTREEQTRSDGGKFSGMAYVLRDVSTSTVSDFPTTEKPSTGKPSSENPTQINKYKQNTLVTNNTPLPPKGERMKRSQPKELVPEVKAMLNAYVAGDPELTEAMQGLMEIRLAPRSEAVNTPRSIRLMLKRLDKLSGGRREDKLEILQQSVSSSWIGVFPTRWQPRGQPRRHTEEVDTW